MRAIRIVAGFANGFLDRALAAAAFGLAAQDSVNLRHAQSICPIGRVADLVIADDVARTYDHKSVPNHGPGKHELFTATHLGRR